MRRRVRCMPGFAFGTGRTPTCMDGTLAIVWARANGPKQAPKEGRRSPLSRAPRPSVTFQSLRDPVLFIVGLLGVAHETLLIVEPRWSLLLIFGAMMGLPPVLRADEARRNGNGG